MKLLLVVLSVLYFAWVKKNIHLQYLKSKEFSGKCVISPKQATPLVTISSTELKEVQEVINAFADLVHTVNFPGRLKRSPLNPTATKHAACNLHRFLLNL